MEYLCNTKGHENIIADHLNVLVEGIHLCD